MDFKNLTQFKAEDFALDDSFRAYVLETNVADIQFWSNWILYHSEKQEEFYNAITLVKALQNSAYIIPEQVKEQELNKLLVSIEEQETEAKVIPLPTQQNRSRPAWRLVAATITGILMPSAAINFIISKRADTTIQYQTAFGEIKEIVLPDNSKVVLNSNSKLVLSSDWNTKKPRKVWVSGEAYFSVTHKKNNQKFTVTTSDGYQIEVLGTQFNVSDRRYKNSVVLKSGKIKLAVKQKNKFRPKQLIMAPGELVEFKANSGPLIRRNVNPDVYTSWKENVLVFDNATLAEISSLLHENYGISVVISDEKLSNLVISGIASTLDLEGFLTGLSKLHHFKIQKVQKAFYLGPSSA